MQDSCSSSIARQRKKLKDLSEALDELVMIYLCCNVNIQIHIIALRSKLKLRFCVRCRTAESPEDVNKIVEIQESMRERPNVFFEMEAFLPKKNG